MNKVLLIFAHPRFEKSKANRALLAAVRSIEGVTCNDLYEEYPDFNIDIEREQVLLTDHSIIVWQYPFYNYSAPALFKQWMDVVLEYGWAHGRERYTLQDKKVFVTLTTGGRRESYAPDQHNRFTLREFLRPFEQTAALCKMVYLPPFAVHGTHLLTKQQLDGYAELYRMLLTRLTNGDFDTASIGRYDYLNDWLANERVK